MAHRSIRVLSPSTHLILHPPVAFPAAAFPAAAFPAAAFVLLAAALLPAAAAADAAGYPPPGNYRIDTETVTSIGTGPQALQQSARIDGASGTVTTTSTAPGQPPATSVAKGAGPITWCVKAATAADVARAKASPFACQTSQVKGSTGSSSFSAACGSVALENSFRQVDPKVWQHTMTFQLSSAPSPMNSAREAYARAMQGMTPAQRAQAEKELASLPSQAEMDRGQAELRQELEEAIRTGSAEDAAAARQVLQNLQGGRGAVRQTVHVEERWTSIGSSCP